MIYSGKKLDDWETPKNIFEKLNSVFNFSFDLAASENNKKVEKHFSKKDDSLSQNWDEIDGTSWLNPPFSQAKQFFKKASQSQNQIVSIYKAANVESQVWQEYIFPYCSILFLKGRVNFEGKEHSTSPTFGSALLFYRIPRLIDTIQAISLFSGSFVYGTQTISDSKNFSEKIKWKMK